MLFSFDEIILNLCTGLQNLLFLCYRFEEEIGLPNLPLPPSPSRDLGVSRQVIGTDTYSQVQRQLDEKLDIVPDDPTVVISAVLPIPPPPPPPPMFVPHQVRMGPVPPMRHRK